jgi:hypothetical protein
MNTAYQKVTPEQNFFDGMARVDKAEWSYKGIVRENMCNKQRPRICAAPSYTREEQRENLTSSNVNNSTVQFKLKNEPCCSRIRSTNT